jgi:hypothetical protein
MVTRPAPLGRTPKRLPEKPGRAQGQAATRLPSASLDPAENLGQGQACPTEEIPPTAQTMGGAPS